MQKVLQGSVFTMGKCPSATSDCTVPNDKNCIAGDVTDPRSAANMHDESMQLLVSLGEIASSFSVVCDCYILL
jgi:hypothetical protein